MSLYSPPAQRKRYPSMPVVSGLRDLLGFPRPSHTPQQEFIEQASARMGVYHFHQGDLFLPGPASFAMDPSHETQLMTVWGHAFLIGPNKWPPLPPMGSVLYAQPLQPLVGIGGQVAGQMVMQPVFTRGVE